MDAANHFNATAEIQLDLDKAGGRNGEKQLESRAGLEVTVPGARLDSGQEKE